MFKYFLLIISFFYISLNISFPQKLLPLSTTKQLDSLKESYKDKVVLINFWASWCLPCIKEFPDLVKLYEDYKGDGFELILISVDETSDLKTKVIPFLAKQKVDFPTFYNNFSDPTILINHIDSDWEGAIPATYIYDKSGSLKERIIGQTGYSDFERTILKYLDK